MGSQRVRHDWVTFTFRKEYRKNPALFSLERASARCMEFVLFPPLWSSQRGANTIAAEPSCLSRCLEPQCPLCLDSDSRPSPTPPQGVRGLAASSSGSLQALSSQITYNCNCSSLRAQSSFHRPLYFISLHCTGEESRSQRGYEIYPASHLPSINDGVN